jgi:hypothetical protein
MRTNGSISDGEDVESIQSVGSMESGFDVNVPFLPISSGVLKEINVFLVDKCI